MKRGLKMKLEVPLKRVSDPIRSGLSETDQRHVVMSVGSSTFILWALHFFDCTLLQVETFPGFVYSDEV